MEYAIVVTKVLSQPYQGPLLVFWINIKSYMDKLSHVQ